MEVKSLASRNLANVVPTERTGIAFQMIDAEVAPLGTIVELNSVLVKEPSILKSIQPPICASEPVLFVSGTVKV